ncbi:MAG: hypothetical protein KGL39_30270 [Patescibacteria group bacterium]|nr:hypothetical protein [Patescibacteria group bacterium]
MKMKKIITLGCLMACCLFPAATMLLSGCNTPQQRIAYNTIFTVEQSASTAVDGYYSLVIRGTVSTNSVPEVSQKFNQLQAACTLAAATTESGTNAVAPAELTTELSDLLTFISTLK